MLAAVLRGEPDWLALPPDVPDAIVTLVRRCLVRDRLERVADASALIYVIDHAREVSPRAAVTTERRPWRRVAPLLLAVAASVLITAMGMRQTAPVAVAEVIRFSIDPAPERLSSFYAPTVGVSPDGRHIAYATPKGVYLRSLADSTARLLPGTAPRGTQVVNPVFSPDGRSLAYLDVAAIGRTTRRTISLDGGVATDLFTGGLSPVVRWEPLGFLFASGRNPVIGRAPPTGGTQRETVVTLPPGSGAMSPQLLPGGRALLFTLLSPLNTGDFDAAQIVAQDLASGRQTMVVDGGSDPRYVPTGHVVYTRRGVLLWGGRVGPGRITDCAGPGPIRGLPLTEGPLSGLSSRCAERA